MPDLFESPLYKKGFFFYTGDDAELVSGSVDLYKRNLYQARLMNHIISLYIPDYLSNPDEYQKEKNEILQKYYFDGGMAHGFRFMYFTNHLELQEKTVGAIQTMRISYLRELLEEKCKLIYSILPRDNLYRFNVWSLAFVSRDEVRDTVESLHNKEVGGLEAFKNFITIDQKVFKKD